MVRGMPGRSTAASRWGTSDLTTPFRAVARSKVDAVSSEGTRTNRKGTCECGPPGSAERDSLWSGAPLRPGSAELDLPGMPSLYLRSQPEARPATAKIKDRPRHVGVPVQVLAHRVAVGEAENPGDVMRIDEIVEEHASSHRTSLHAVADPRLHL